MSGGIPRGSQHASAKLDEDKVRAIRASTEKNMVLAKLYGVSQATICMVRNRKIWRHVL